LRPDGTLSPETATRRFLSSLDQPSRILVAISGGSDSTGLLVALSNALTAAPNSNISLCAATVDHALRPESADEARDVAALCRSLDIPHVTKVWHGTKPKAGIMAAARDARYELLAEAADELGADTIVTGHTLDDQRETFAMRGQRSAANVTGIGDAVLFDRRIWVMRPLLCSLRTDIRALLTRRGVRWFDDPSNDDPKYERVRMRQALSGQGISVAEIASMAAARSALDVDAARWLDTHVSLHGGMLAQVSPGGLAAERSLLGHALSRLAAVFGGQPFALGTEPMERVLDFLALGQPGRVTAGRVVFDLRRDGLFLARESRGMVPLAVAAGASAVWDGRYVVENRSEADVVVSDAQELEGGMRQDARGGAGNLAAEDLSRLPKSALKRALAAQPQIYVSAISGNPANQIRITPYFAPFDRFLTRLDFMFAASLTVAFGTRPYPKPPLGLIDGKTI
jgi:tRNA(Ile)-lysidine synthase